MDALQTVLDTAYNVVDTAQKVVDIAGTVLDTAGKGVGHCTECQLCNAYILMCDFL